MSRTVFFLALLLAATVSAVLPQIPNPIMLLLGGLVYKAAEWVADQSKESEQ